MVINMKDLKYYVDLRNDFLLAYERTTEFFVMYDPKSSEWKDCTISFISFRHDCEFKEISYEEALAKTNGVLPEDKLTQYRKLINSNMGNQQ